jgi:hypothetical protein
MCRVFRCWCDGSGGVFEITGGSLLTIKDSRFDSNGAEGNGNFINIESDSTVRIAGSTITNSSGGTPWTIYDTTGNDFAVQLDTVEVDDTFRLFSSDGLTLAQNCDGLREPVAKNASIATCESTSEYCIPKSCFDKAIGIECICIVDGVENPFPIDCMQVCA